MTLHEREAAHFFHTYKRLPLEIERGEGMHLYAKDGKRYLDMFGGLAVNALGYAHPRVLAAINEQSRNYIHLSNFFLQEPQIRLAEKLLHASGYSRVLFGNSGTEAIEAALKISRKWGKPRGKTRIISFTNAFHGRTMGALSIMDREKYREGFEPFLAGCDVVEYNDPDALCRTVSESTAAVILEFIQGEGGIASVGPKFTKMLRSLQKKFCFLIVADEIQSGIGRTGRFFGYQHFDIMPDIVTVAKPLGGGLPLGAILGSPALADVLEPGAHGTTFGGNPVACAAGIVVLDEIVEKGLMDHATAMGAILRKHFDELRQDFPAIIKESRGYGLMMGLNLNMDGEGIVTAMRERHRVLINCTAGTVLRFLPPLILGKEHIEETASALREVFSGL